MGPETRPYAHGSVIVIAMIVFFPLALFLIFSRHTKHSGYTHLRILDYSLYGKLCLVISTAPLIGHFAQEVEGARVLFFVGVAFLAAGLLFLAKSRQLNRQMLARFEEYETLIYQQNVTSIVDIANRVGAKIDTVVNELHRMSYLGLLPDVTVDGTSFQVWRNPDSTLNQETYESSSFSFHIYSDDDSDVDLDDQIEAILAAGLAREERELLPKTVECAGCGAKAQLKPRENKVCEYCQSTLQYA